MKKLRLQFHIIRNNEYSPSDQYTMCCVHHIAISEIIFALLFNEINTIKLISQIPIDCCSFLSIERIIKASYLLISSLFFFVMIIFFLGWETMGNCVSQHTKIAPKVIF